MKKLGNVLTGILHIAGLAFVAAMCIVKHLKPGDPEPLHPLYDLLLILAAVILIAIHYFIFERFFSHKIRTWILAFFECIVAVAFIALIIIPNEFLSITLYDGVVVLIVQLLIVSARVISVVNSYRSVGEN